MVEIIIAIIKYSVLFAGSLYGFLKLLQIKLKWLNLLDLPVAVVCATALYFATKYLRLLLPAGFWLLTFLYCLARYRRSVLITATTSVISCGITIISMVVAFVVSIPIEMLTFTFIPNEEIRNIITVCIVSILQLLAIFLIFKIKRLRSGISIQNNNGTIEILLLISILSIFLMTLLYTDNVANSPTELIVITITFCGLGLIIWWKKHVANNYQKQLYKRNEEIYEHQIGEYEKELEKLKSHNDDLAKIIHRDNKLIPAMAAAVEKLIANAPDKSEYEDLLKQLKNLSTERNLMVESYQAKSDNLPKTGNCSLDTVMRFLSDKAARNNVSAAFEIADGAIAAVLQVFKDSVDLITIILDLGENAVIAAKNTENAKIMITFEIENSVASINFYDNGPPFDKSVTENMGKKRVTTHKGEGGSGIGLMTLFEILNKYNASYSLDGNTDREGFTKHIRILLDNMRTITVEKQ